MQSKRGRVASCLASLLLALVALPARAAPSGAEWAGGSGSWDKPAGWEGNRPDAFTEAAVHGVSELLVPPGDWSASRLEVGTNPGDRARVEVAGGRLAIDQDSLIVGESTGGEGTVVLDEGAIYSRMDVFIGAATGSTGRMNRASLIVRGGTFEGLSLTVGEGLGSVTRVSIEGSRPASVHALEFAYFLAYADPSGKPGESTLAFTLDSHGVTPITIQSRWDGLRIEHDSASRCRLLVALSGVPPRDDVVLVSARVPIQGTFDGLPEGARVSADFNGWTYHWVLTYRGGPGGHDLVLKNRSTYPAGAPITHCRSLPEPPLPPWAGHPLLPPAIPAGTPAFPGAEGYGAYTPGGRGGRTIAVENLNDEGPGSLRAAALAGGPRLVVFRVGGVIALKSPIVIQNPFLTISGQGAPAPGITLRRHGIEVRTHDVVLRQFRIRIGDEDVRRNDRNIRYAAGDGEYALYFTEGSRNCIADHLSLTWSTNKILSTTKGSDLVTVQWCLLGESLNLDGHGYASIAGGNRVSWHHNLFAHNFSRNPRFQGAVDADFRNNVIYDWGEESAYGEFDRLNFVANYLKPGPSLAQARPLFHAGREVVMPGSLYLAGNIMAGQAAMTRNNWLGTRFIFDRAKLEASQPFPAPAVMTESAQAAFADVLANAGATAPSRDAIDARIVRETRTGTGRIVESVKEAGGWPAP